MIGSNLQPATVVSRPINATAAGTTAINGSAVDLQGAEGVEFYCLMGALTATQVTSLKAQGSADGVSAWTDLTGAVTGNAADADSNKVLRLEVFRPQTFPRFIRPVVNRGTANAAIDGVIAVVYGQKKMPKSAEDATVSQAKFIQSP